MDVSTILEASNITQTFRSGDHQLTVLDQINFTISSGTTCAIVGPSGSGKTTLLGLCAGLDRPTKGDIKLNNVALGPLSEDERAEVRNKYVGFVFQTFQLVPTLTALENVMVPLELRGQKTEDVSEEAIELLTEVGLSDRLQHYPSQLSGGEQQRVAIARAFINKPKILFADEPTGNLDAETGATIEKLLFDLNEINGTTLVLVTHDLSLAKQCKRTIHLKNGQIEKDESSSPVKMEQINN
ncbi:ABC transporter ATP-binding protein [Fodinibius salsisoli]|uniref:ABC transporter ATP-binding protein n=1 Tax=Fodinibius salsisoli TaxID=2820877 RepID=A0ABT3PR63_9BACT|nr:ABC transporter ATP-binding protein [Fodinibius salsisoli]MCW9708357.1 ABC transporter ATP-binding protein [Fodinibius salsisoli]